MIKLMLISLLGCVFCAVVFHPLLSPHAPLWVPVFWALLCWGILLWVPILIPSVRRWLYRTLREAGW